jgi:hypothetical protein
MKLREIHWWNAAKAGTDGRSFWGRSWLKLGCCSNDDDNDDMPLLVFVPEQRKIVKYNFKILE